MVTEVLFAGGVNFVKEKHETVGRCGERTGILSLFQ